MTIAPKEQRMIQNFANSLIVSVGTLCACSLPMRNELFRLVGMVALSCGAVVSTSCTAQIQDDSAASFEIFAKPASEVEDPLMTDEVTVTAGIEVGSNSEAATYLPAEKEFFQLINQERERRGIARLRSYCDLQDDARAHSQRMRARRDLYHNPELVDVTWGWTKLAENVGRGPSVGGMHDAFMASTYHRQNILDPNVRYLGVGAASRDGVLYITQVFAAGPFSGQPSPCVQRLAGPDRYATAAAVSRAHHTDASTVFIATGLNFPDAITAGPAATRRRAPILLTGRDRLPDATIAELRRLEPSSAVIVGGTGVVSSYVVSQLRGLGINVRRLSGDNRFQTAAAISADTFRNGARRAYIANGSSYTDALIAASMAGVAPGPVLLTEQDGLPYATARELERLGPRKIIILSTGSAVSSAVESRLGKFANSVVRIAATSPHRLSVNASRSVFGSPAPAAFIATSQNFPDALSGVVAANRVRAPLLLVTRSSLPSRVASELERLDPARTVILGGTAAVDGSVQNAIENVVR